MGENNFANIGHMNCMKLLLPNVNNIGLAPLIKLPHSLIIYKSKNKYPTHNWGNSSIFTLLFGIREANHKPNHQGLTSLHVQNFLQFVETVQFFIAAAFHAPEYSAVEKIFSWTVKAIISI